MTHRDGPGAGRLSRARRGMRTIVRDWLGAVRGRSHDGVEELIDVGRRTSSRACGITGVGATSGAGSS